MFLLPGEWQAADEAYQGIQLDMQLLFAVAALEEKGLPANFENVTAASFSLFPDRFHLRGISAWPDSLLVYRSLLRCRGEKGWLSGSVRARFRLTPAGRAVLEDAVRAAAPAGLREGERTPDAYTVAALAEFRRSRAFRDWVRFGRMAEHPAEVLLALQCTSRSECRLKRERYRQLRDCAELVGDREIQACLSAAKAAYPAEFALPGEKAGRNTVKKETDDGDHGSTG